MTFEAPWYAILVVILPVCLLLYGYAQRRKKAAMDQLVGSGMKTAVDEASKGSTGYQFLPSWLLTAVIASLVLALMQPLWGKRAEEMPRMGRDIVVLLDTSLSMLAEDVAPNRIERAKSAIRDLVAAVEVDGGHRLSLIVFAGRPSLQSPLTLDYQLFLQRLQETNIETVAYEGSLIGDAIHHALERLGDLEPGFVDLILVTDGEDHGGLPIDAAAAAASTDFDLYTLGIGDPETGVPIPIVDADGKRSLLEHDGFEVRSRVQADLLAEMAQLTKGRYLGTVTDSGSDILQALYQEVLADKPRRELETEETELPAHRFQVFVLITIFLLLFYHLWVGRSARTA